MSGPLVMVRHVICPCSMSELSSVLSPKSGTRLGETLSIRALLSGPILHRIRFMFASVKSVTSVRAMYQDWV